jgi:transcriptional regulator GlxA family with amidase domain
MTYRGCFCAIFLMYFYIMKARNRMNHVSVVVIEDAVLSSLSGSYSLLFTANERAKREGIRTAFNIELVGTNVKNVQLNLPVQFICTKTISDDFKTDLVIVPPISTLASNVNAVLKKNRELIEWLRKQREQGAALVSICTGSYFLAEAGLLDGKEATSHWGFVEDMRRRYPRIDWKPDNTVTHDNGIYTGGGSYSSLNAILKVIETYFGKAIAVAVSKEFSIDFGRTSQSIFAVFTGQRQHTDPDIHKAQDYIENNFKVDISVAQVAVEVGMSKRNFIRRFKQATQINPIEYIQLVKIESAKKSIEAGETRISSVTYDVGYNDLKTFRTVFKRTTGLSPQEYAKKYNSSL